ncbi:MAG: hypothetical protein CMJ72_04800 [Planctomycetaceae bacterium]|nr:hypothetical protein [Planctomycetaceae bacterium]MCH2595516.1 sulfotransferase domain-containing protein [Pirellulales bacterium]HCK42177.1 hypothetical protein [Planctomycetaceae bacterium]
MNITKALYHQNGLVRKSSAAILRGARFAKRCRQTQEDLEACPPVFVNSLPKSGTHLLNQLVTAFPNLVEYGAFLGSMTSSYRFRERSKQNTLKFIQSFLAKEIVRGHLFYELEYDLALRKQNVVHYFIYRDLRDVVVSEAYYLRNINRWHRLHAYFRELPTLADAITCSICGLNDQWPGINYPNIADRFARYAGWLESPTVCTLKFEDLVGSKQEESLTQITDFYSRQLCYDINPERYLEAMRVAIAPKRSHTFRKGKSGGWRNEFTSEHRKVFNTLAGDLLINLGYETDDSWV